MSRSSLVGLALSLCILSSVTLTLATFQEPAAAETIRCLYGEVVSGQGAISAAANGTFTDSWVYSVWASTGSCPSAGNVRVTIEEVSNINMAITAASPSSYNLCATGGGDTDCVYDAYRQIGVSGGLDCVHLDGTFDATIDTSETPDHEVADGTVVDVNVDAADPETGC